MAKQYKFYYWKKKIIIISAKLTKLQSNVS